MRHTRAVQRARTTRQNTAPPDDQIAQRLTEVVHPATLAQIDAFHKLGLRERLLTLPIMMAFVVSLIWRQIGSVCEAVRVLQREGMRWCTPLSVSQQAVEQRRNALPAELIHAVLHDILPQMQQRWHERDRPLPPELAWAQQHYSAVLALDGATLDQLLRPCGLLREGSGPVLAGRIAALLDVCSQLPRTLWYEEDRQAHDQRFWERTIDWLEAGTLLLIDLGFTNYAIFDQVTTARVTFITRLKRNAHSEVVQVLQRSATLHDEVVRLGSGSGACTHPMRVIAVLYHGKWYRYLTNETDPTRLPAAYVVALSWQRWRIEEALHVVKRLLGLAYFWAGSINAMQMQLWATWIVYAVLIDLTDAVAEELRQPVAALSVEMVYRGLYHFTQARQRGEADDVVAYLAAHAKSLGILKRQRRSPKDAFLADLTNMEYLNLLLMALRGGYTSQAFDPMKARIACGSVVCDLSFSQKNSQSEFFCEKDRESSALPEAIFSAKCGIARYMAALVASRFSLMSCCSWSKLPPLTRAVSTAPVAAPAAGGWHAPGTPPDCSVATLAVLRQSGRYRYG